MKAKPESPSLNSPYFRRLAAAQGAPGNAGLVASVLLQFAQHEIAELLSPAITTSPPRLGRTALLALRRIEGAPIETTAAVRHINHIHLDNVPFFRFDDVDGPAPNGAHPRTRTKWPQHASWVGITNIFGMVQGQRWFGVGIAPSDADKTIRAVWANLQGMGVPKKLPFTRFDDLHSYVLREVKPGEVSPQGLALGEAFLNPDGPRAFLAPVLKIIAARLLPEELAAQYGLERRPFSRQEKATVTILRMAARLHENDGPIGRAVRELKAHAIEHAGKSLELEVPVHGCPVSRMHTTARVSELSL